MKFNIGDALGAKETGKFLSPGIKDAVFEGLEFETGTGKDGNSYQAMLFKVTVEGYGLYTQKFFEPKDDERKDNPWGGKNASPADNFMILIREILETLNPEIMEQLSDGTLKLRGKGKFNGTFRELILAMIEVTAPFVGEKIQIKVLPQSNGFSAIPVFIARITRTNELAIGSWVIGHELTLDDREKKLIDNASNARPTNMATNAAVADMKADLAADDDSDLPF